MKRVLFLSVFFLDYREGKKWLPKESGIGKNWQNKILPNIFESFGPDFQIFPYASRIISDITSVPLALFCVPAPWPFNVPAPLEAATFSPCQLTCHVGKSKGLPREVATWACTRRPLFSLVGQIFSTILCMLQFKHPQPRMKCHCLVLFGPR